MWLDFLRVLSIVAVLLLHVSAYFVINRDVGSASWLIGNSIDSLLRWCVPVFVMISGALLLDSSKSESLSIFYSKRVKKILVPIIFYTTLYSLWKIFRAYVSGQPIELSLVLIDALNGEAFYHLWFLFMIIGLYAFTPFFRVFAGAVHHADYKVFISLACGLSAIASVVQSAIGADSGLALFSFITFVPYFFLGHWMRFTTWQPSNFVCSVGFFFSYAITFFGSWFFSVVYGLEAGLSFYEYNAPNVMAMAIFVFALARNSISDRFKYANSTSFVLPYVFGIYLIHLLILDLLMYKQVIVNELNPILSIIVLFFVLTLLSILTSFLMGKNKYLKRLM